LLIKSLGNFDGNYIFNMGYTTDLGRSLVTANLNSNH
jgi:hypothetical protein